MKGGAHEMVGWGSKEGGARARVSSQLKSRLTKGWSLQVWNPQEGGAHERVVIARG